MNPWIMKSNFGNWLHDLSGAFETIVLRVIPALPTIRAEFAFTPADSSVQSGHATH